MIRKHLILAAAALALAIPSVGAPAFAAAPKAPVAAPTQPAMPKYDDLHKGAVAMLTKFKTMLTSEPEVTARLADLPAELNKLPALEKAYVDAKNAGDEAAAKKAADDYVAAAQKIVDLALPLDQGLGPIQGQIAMGFAQLGPTGEKLLAEKDVVALNKDIETILAPLDAANKAVGEFHDNAAQAAQLRMKAEAARIAKEEFANQVNNFLQGQAAK
jgi:hypothetical protein